jgi:D-alanyl-D-alanine dipeptidase
MLMQMLWAAASTMAKASPHLAGLVKVVVAARVRARVRASKAKNTQGGPAKEVRVAVAALVRSATEAKNEEACLHVTYTQARRQEALRFLLLYTYKNF